MPILIVFFVIIPAMIYYAIRSISEIRSAENWRCRKEAYQEWLRTCCSNKSTVKAKEVVKKAGFCAGSAWLNYDLPGERTIPDDELAAYRELYSTMLVYFEAFPEQCGIPQPAILPAENHVRRDISLDEMFLLKRYSDDIKHPYDDKDCLNLYLLAHGKIVDPTNGFGVGCDPVDFFSSLCMNSASGQIRQHKWLEEQMEERGIPTKILVSFVDRYERDNRSVEMLCGYDKKPIKYYVDDVYQALSNPVFVEYIDREDVMCCFSWEPSFFSLDIVESLPDSFSAEAL